MRSAVLLLPFMLACGKDAATAAPSCTGVELLVAASDYGSSVLCGAPGCVESPGHTTGKTLGADPMLASSNGRAFYLVRDDNAVLTLDPQCGTATGLLSLASLAGPSGQTNPHDVAVAADGTTFVALYDVPKIAFAMGNKLQGFLDLSSYDPDGNPQADSIAIVGDKAFVALERLDDHDNLKSKQTSQMLRIDVPTRTPEATIELEGKNPFNAMAIENGQLFLAEPGDPDVANEDDAGIERFDTTTSTTKLLVHEKDLGGSVVEVLVSGSCGVAIVAGPVPKVNPTALVSFDPITGAVLHSYTSPLLGPTSGYQLQALAFRGSTLYVGDRQDGKSGSGIVHELALSGACDLAETTTTILLPMPPVAFLPAAAKAL